MKKHTSAKPGPLVYTGIGSRQTPQWALEVMTGVAAALAVKGWTLRSGHAPGADQAFEAGARYNAEVYLPWHSFEENTPIYGERHDKASIGAHNVAQWQLDIENFLGLKRTTRDLLARNCHQVLGWDLKTPSRFVIAWTPDPFPSGGTRHAIRLADRYHIPVFNMGDPQHLARVERML